METLISNQENQSKPPIDDTPISTVFDGMPKKRNYIPWILGILVLVVIFTTSFLILTGKSKSTSTEPLIQPSVSPEQTTVADTDIDMSDWKTYTNPVFGYSLKYPQSGFIEIDSSDSVIIWSNKDKGIIEGSDRNAITPYVRIGTYKLSSNKSLEQNVDKKENPNSDTVIYFLSKKLIEINGLKFTEFAYKNDVLEKVFYSTYIPKNDNLYGFFFQNSDVNFSSNSFYQQILSTFKFTQTNDPEVIVPNVIQQLIPQVKWGTQEIVSDYPADLGMTIPGLQRTGTITNPDVEGNPYIIDELLKDKNSLTNLGWSKSLPIGASGPFLSIATYYKRINGVNTRLEFHIENADYVSAANPGDLSLVKCPCVNKISVFQQQ